jgi:3-oxoacyl-[acyl-carrier-protein] synthase III
MNVEISSIAYYLPENVETGSELKKDNPDWDIDKIEEKTGIKTRYISDNDQTALDMSVIAAESLLQHKVNIKDIDFLIFVTQSPEYVLPTTACLLQDKLGLSKNCMAFDVNLGCSGFVYGLSIGGSLIESGLVKGGLLVCSDTYSKYIDKNDRTCRPLFSDGASVTYLKHSNKSRLGPFELGTDGSGVNNLIVPQCGSRTSVCDTKKLHMSGSDIFMFSMYAVPNCIESLLIKSNFKISDIDLFVFHQASKLVIDNIVRRLNIPQENFFINYENIGNTVSASIPIALHSAVKKGVLSNGDRVMLVGFGVGYSWGGCIVEWNFND